MFLVFELYFLLKQGIKPDSEKYRSHIQLSKFGMNFIGHYEIVNFYWDFMRYRGRCTGVGYPTVAVRQ